MPRWEYRVERHYPSDVPSHGEHRGSGLDSFDALDKLGEEGWELISIVLSGQTYELIFKRQFRVTKEK
jgi:hypothetical protein